MSLKHDLYLSRKPLAGFAAIGAAWATYFAQMPVIKAQVGASDGEYGMAVLISAFGALGAMWLAPFAQRIAGGMSVPLGIVMITFGMLGAGASPALWMLTLTLLLVAMGSGIVDVLINAQVAEIEEDSGRALMNLNHALYSFTYAGAALATGGLRSAGVGPVATFALLSIFMAFLFWAAIGKPLKDQSDPDGIPAAGLSLPLVTLAGIVVLVAFLAEAATEGWSALHLERSLSGTPAQGAMGPVLLGLMMGFGRLFGHGLSSVIRDTTLMVLATLVSASGIVLAGMADSVGLALIGFAIGGLGISVVAPLAFSLLGRSVRPSLRLQAISRASVIGYGAFFFGPPLMGLVAEGFGLRTAFVVVAILLALVALAIVPLLARRASEAQAQLRK